MRNNSATLARLSLSAIDELAIKRLVTDGRHVESGDIFLAYPGEVRDGRNFIAQALANGAESVLWESRDYRWNPELAQCR